MIGKSLLQLSTALKEKKISSVELTKIFLERVKASKLNSFITITEDYALKKAVICDNKRIKSDKVGVLSGIPYALKDIFCTEGILTTAGSKMLSNFISPYSATVSKRMLDADCILLGKNNMDEFAMGSSNENSYFGNVKNPWNLSKVPGGSSGGSAACVSAKLAPFSLGTDTGGSIRQPASLCGISGLKPTYGRVSRHGVIAFASSLDCPGVLALSAKDIALVMSEISGFDKLDSTSSQVSKDDYFNKLDSSIEGLKIGIPKEFFSDDLDSKVGDLVIQAIDEYKKMGAIVKDISLKSSAYSVPIYYILAPCECSSNLLRYDGIRFGYSRDKDKSLSDLYEYSRSEGFGSEVKRRILIGTYALSEGYYDAYYVKAQKVRNKIRNEYKEIFNDVDVIMTPTAPTVAFDFNKNSNPMDMYLSDLYTIPANLAGIPAISIPAGFVDNLPVGLQIMGNYFSEAKLLNVAHKYQLNNDWHTKKPTYY